MWLNKTSPLGQTQKEGTATNRNASKKAGTCYSRLDLLTEFELLSPEYALEFLF